MTSSKTKDMVMTALMAAIIFVATYLIRIPNPATGGYSHLGDCMIFLAVVLLGRKNGSAAAIGGAFSDFLAGAAIWILPTLVIKYIMAFIMGTIIMASPANKKLQLAGAVTGGILQIIAYTLAKVVLIGKEAAILSIPNVSIQTAFGIAIFMIISAAAADLLLKFMKKEGIIK